MKIFRYTSLSHSNIDVIDNLVNLIDQFPPGSHARVVMEVGSEKAATGHILIRGDLGTEVVLQSGIGFELIDQKSYQSMPVVSQALSNIDEYQFVAVKEGASITRPTMTRQLTCWLMRKGYVAVIIFDFSPTRSAGLINFNLTFLFRGNKKAADQLSYQVSEIMFAESSVRTARCEEGFIRGLALCELWERPRLPACAGNIADLFPL